MLTKFKLTVTKIKALSLELSFSFAWKKQHSQFPRPLKEDEKERNPFPFAAQTKKGDQTTTPYHIISIQWGEGPDPVFWKHHPSLLSIWFWLRDHQRQQIHIIDHSSKTWDPTSPFFYLFIWGQIVLHVPLFPNTHSHTLALHQHRRNPCRIKIYVVWELLYNGNCRS